LKPFEIIQGLVYQYLTPISNNIKTSNNFKQLLKHYKNDKGASKNQVFLSNPAKSFQDLPPFKKILVIRQWVRNRQPMLPWAACVLKQPRIIKPARQAACAG
jgi:hypothetical protein